jgi:N-methylhydantoinase A
MPLWRAGDRLAGTGGSELAERPPRRAYFPELRGYVDCAVYPRRALRAEVEIEGPALIEEQESTAVVLPGHRARVDAEANLVIESRRR